MQTTPFHAVFSAPISTRLSAAFAAARITYTLLQFLAPLGGAAAAQPPVAAHAAAPVVQAAFATHAH